MKLAMIKVTRLNTEYIDYKWFETDEELKLIEKYYKNMEKKLYNDPCFVGYYSFYIDICDDFGKLRLNELQGITLKDLKLILESIK